MSAKENFNQAMFEMFGVGKEPKAEDKAAETNTKKEHTAEVKQEVKAEKKQPVKPVYAKTVLAEGTYFEGTLNSKGDVEIAGVFKGDITTDGNVIIRADVTGNIKAASLDVLSNTLTGDIDATDSVKLAAGSQVKGNITAKDIVCSGKIMGDMTIDGEANFDELSHVTGNVTAKYITIHRGAFIDGKITIAK